MVEKYDGYISLLRTIPDVDRSSAITIISEVGVDMAQFGSSKRFAAALVQVAYAAVMDKQNPYYALKYERIAKRRGKKRAIIAIARMILSAIYSLLSNVETWNPVNLYKVDMPEHLKEQQLQKAVKQTVRFLETQGLKVS